MIPRTVTAGEIGTNPREVEFEPIEEPALVPGLIPEHEDEPEPELVPA